MYENAIAAIEARAKRFGPMRDANGYAKVHGECDDIVEIWLRIDGGKIRSGSFMTNGCGFSKHCCNRALQLAEGMKPDEAADLTQAQVLEATGPLPEDHEHCAALAAETIGLAVDNFLNPPPHVPLSERLKKMLTREAHHA